MGALTVPDSLDNLSPDWMTAALAARLAPGARVTGLRLRRIGEQTGNLSVLGRFGLEFSGDPGPDVPASVVVKLPIVSPFHRRQADRFSLYEREVGFYRDLGPSCGARVPRAYATAWDPDERSFALVLEDLSGLRPGVQASLATPEDAALAVDALASVHSRWWRSKTLAGFAWLPGRDSPPSREWTQTFLRRVPLFVERWGGRFDPALDRALPVLAERFASSWEALYRLPLTLAHGDFRLDNLFFAEDAQGSEAVIVDWQFCQQLPGTVDLHYFLAGNLPGGCRPSTADEYVRRYHEGLLAGGVRGYSLAQVREDYARAALWLVVFAVSGVAPADPATMDDQTRGIIEMVHRRLIESFVAHEAERFLVE